FILLYLMALPIMTETEMILQLWLKVVPSYAPIFTRLLLCVAMVDSIANPMMIGASATGNIKEYHLKVGGILLCALPIAILVLKLGFPIVSVFIVLILVVITAQIVRMYICRKLYHFSFQRFYNEVIKKLVVVVLISTILPVLLHFIVPEGFWYSFFVCVVAVLSVGVTSYFLGLTQTEQMFVKSKIPFLK
ncbi:MAG: lipopolysaccharide biosynthesis protein, partial [Bacteroidaceae bacterium]|nr:lipopolysaccharide biosynthesis protein [Bacteroidaceae bacterium]